MTSLVLGSSFRFCCRQLFTRTTKTETAFAARRRLAIFSSSSSMKNKRSIKRRNQNEENWKSLRTTRDDLSLDRTLPTGQSFRWQEVEEYDENDENEKKY